MQRFLYTFYLKMWFTFARGCCFYQVAFSHARLIVQINWHAILLVNVHVLLT
jgi:hypothetical protein